MCFFKIFFMDLYTSKLPLAHKACDSFLNYAYNLQTPSYYSKPSNDIDIPTQTLTILPRIDVYLFKLFFLSMDF